MTFSSCSTFFCSSGNLSLVDADLHSGFALYRSGWPDEELINEYCKRGITEIMVLSGNAEELEQKYKNICPDLNIVYNQKQDPGTPLDNLFLQQFDDWIARAQSQGKRVAIRCDCGSHRTGRLAAYYQMKYQHLTNEDAKAILGAKGKWMLLYPNIYRQVDGLSDYIHGKSCSVDRKDCVITK
ncbi:MAG: dual specificity protein phosphatase family protein [Oligoflexia bacterium]|nr:dual specificity protein phosphatase family protein [Oligoflexia bacterium]